MTTARAQPLLADSELAKAHDFLFGAHMLVTDVRSLFFNSDDFATAARLKDIQGRLADEFHAVERLIEQAGSSPLNLADPEPSESTHGSEDCGRTLQRLHSGTCDMDRDTLKRHLTKVEEQVAIAAQNVARQRELVAELERDGYDATQAKKMLEQFLEQQALHIADRDRLIKELSEFPPSL